jgi:hypothetical protein
VVTVFTQQSDAFGIVYAMQILLPHDHVIALVPQPAARVIHVPYVPGVCWKKVDGKHSPFAPSMPHNSRPALF